MTEAMATSTRLRRVFSSLTWTFSGEIRYTCMGAILQVPLSGHRPSISWQNKPGIQDYMRFAGRVAVRIGSTCPQKAEDSQLANCRQCGAKLPSFTFGEVSPYCKTCRSQRSES